MTDKQILDAIDEYSHAFLLTDGDELYKIKTPIRELVPSLLEEIARQDKLKAN